MSEQTVSYTVHTHHEDDGSLWAEVADLPGCFASGFD
jgi:predicted RNase H-like HicB family nuclease